MDDIAEAAELTKRTLYHHFNSKDQLLADVLESQHHLALQAFRTFGDNLSGSAETIVGAMFQDLAVWADRPRWAGSGFTRLVIELADLPGHPASHPRAPRRDPMVTARSTPPYSFARTGDGTVATEPLVVNDYEAQRNRVASGQEQIDGARQGYPLIAASRRRDRIDERRIHCPGFARSAQAPQSITDSSNTTTIMCRPGAAGCTCSDGVGAPAKASQ